MVCDKTLKSTNSFSQWISISHGLALLSQATTSSVNRSFASFFFFFFFLQYWGLFYVLSNQFYHSLVTDVSIFATPVMTLFLKITQEVHLFFLRERLLSAACLTSSFHFISFFTFLKRTSLTIPPKILFLRSNTHYPYML